MRSSTAPTQDDLFVTPDDPQVYEENVLALMPFVEVSSDDNSVAEWGCDWPVDRFTGDSIAPTHCARPARYSVRRSENIPTTSRFVHLCWRHGHIFVNVLVQAFESGIEYRTPAQQAPVTPYSWTPGDVYFVEREDAIKIGFSTNFSQRLRSITSGTTRMPSGMTVGPVVVLGTIPGTLASERALHLRFSHLRIEGEWFRKDAEILSFLRSQIGA